MKTFRELFENGYSVQHPTAQLFREKLLAHGEVQLNLASGAVWSVHLGDVGDLYGDHVCFRDAKGNVVSILWQNVEYIWTHLASQD